MFEKDTLKSKIKKLELQGVKFKGNGQEIELIRCPNDYKGKFEIPDGVTSIGDGAFMSCINLTDVKIPDSVTRIGCDAFACCENLTDVKIPNSVKRIRGRTFCECTKLTSITIPDSVTSIGDNAFICCDDLTDVKIPNSVTKIGELAFAGCNNLTSITIPDSVTEIGVRAFAFCNNLTSVTIPDSVTEIGGYAFQRCNNLTSVTIPDSVVEIGDGAFANCDNLTSVAIPDSVTKIGEWAFCECENLTSVIIPDSVTSIGRKAFDSHVLLNIKIAGNSRKEVYAGLYNSLLECGKLDKLADVDSDFVKNIVMKNNFLRLIKANDWEIYPNNGEEDYFTLMYNLGLFAKKGTMIEMSDHSKEPIQNVGYAILQRLFNGVNPSEYLDIKNIHKYFGEMEPTNDINEGFIKFLYNKANLDNVIQKEKTQPGYITSVLDGFE